MAHGTSTVFCNNMGFILKAAPEHVRPVSAVEARLIPLDQVASKAQMSQEQPNPMHQSTSNAMPESQGSTTNAPPVNNPNQGNPTEISQPKYPSTPTCPQSKFI